MKVIECVPNFSEGNNQSIIDKITYEISIEPNITLLDVDSGANTNRTVVTFVGNPENIIEAAYRSIKKASELIDLRNHKGAHARMGATDVCPLIPISNITMEECINYSNILAEKVANNLNIPVFLYEESASNPIRKNLANIREGEFEGMSDKLKKSTWNSDYGPNKIHPTAGSIAIGARNFLIAYNININTREKSIASDIALDIREKGRNIRGKNGKFIRDDNGNPIKKPGIFKECKAVGWYLEEYNQAQISINLTNISITSPHEVFEECRYQARKRGVRVTGSEIVGMIPLNTMLETGKYFLNNQKKSTGIPDKDIIDIAMKSLGLNNLSPFKPMEKIIEYAIKPLYGNLASQNIYSFCDILSSSSPAPGGGSVSALAGSLGSSLSAMVANLTFGKKKWHNLYDKMCELSQKSQFLKNKLLILIDEDTNAFNQLITSYRLPKSNKDEISYRNKKIKESMKIATNVPFKTLEYCYETMIIIKQVAIHGNPNSISDAGVAGEITNAGAHGAALNVLINLKEIKDKRFCQKLSNNTSKLLIQADKELYSIRKIVKKKINNE